MSSKTGIRRQAVLDIGSNSVRLEVADVSKDGIERVYHEEITSRLIEGMENGMLSDAAVARTQRAIRALADDARARGAEYVYAFGTSALRDGENRAAIIDNARAYGIRFRLLAPEDEAILAFDSVEKDGARGVIDIGGGSTEIVTGVDGAIASVFSAQLGAVRLFDMTSGSRNRDYLLYTAKRILEEPCKEARALADVEWTAEGGTSTALGCVLMGLPEYDPLRAEGYRIERSRLSDALDRFCALSPVEIKAIEGMEEKRADIIHCGAAILLCAMELLGVQHVAVSSHDNMLSYLNGCVRKSLFG